MENDNHPARALDVEERRQKFKEALVLWIGNRRLDQAMKREELAQLEGIQRHLTLSKSTILAAIRICRREKRADTRLAVLVLITHLCDNNNGLCVLGIKRMAELLDRKEDNVRDAIKSLEAAGDIGVNRTTGGMLNSYWPIVPAAIATMNPAATWFVDALSDRPVRTRPVLVPQEGDPPCSRGVGVTPPVAGGYPPAGGPQYISTSSAKKDSKPYQTIPQGGTVLEQPRTTGRSNLPGAPSLPDADSHVNATRDTPKKPTPLPPSPTVECYNITSDEQGTEEYIHEAADGRKVPISEMSDAHLFNAAKLHAKVLKKVDGDVLAEVDTVPALRAMLVEMQRRGLTPPKGAPSLKELDDLIARTGPTRVSNVERDEEAAVKECPQCATIVDHRARRCSECRYDWRSRKPLRPDYRDYKGGQFRP